MQDSGTLNIAGNSVGGAYTCAGAACVGTLRGHLNQVNAVAWEPRVFSTD